MEKEEMKTAANVEPKEKVFEKTWEKKPLTEEQKIKRTKMWLFPFMTILCALFVWWIFSSSPQKDEKGANGFNTEMPEADNEAIVGDKRKAYATAELEKKQEEKRKAMGTLGDIFGEERKDSAGFSLIEAMPVPTEQEKREANAIRSSAVAYDDLNTTLGSFYEQPRNDDAEKDELHRRIDELEAEMMNGDDSHQSSMEEQVALMEKSYQLAAKYLPNGQSFQTVDISASKETKSDKPKASPVRQVQKQVVSSLAQPMSDGDFVQAFTERADAGFNTAVGSVEVFEKNTISACIHGDQTITDGQTVRLRLLEPMNVDNRIIPRNTVVVGSTRMQGERLGIALSSIEYGGMIIPIELAVYDTDGQEGIFIPNSMEMDAAKEIGANMGSSLNSSINISANAGAQLASDLGKGVIQGVSQYISKRMRTVKVHLKAGYKVLLYQEDK